ncbi:MAG: 4-phosphopantetheinyl transferase family protein [Winogradskyella sp.]|uniref:4'-phosphopantetheinyl transferase family protein n=1 Tax=Winogradskyella sp. TaxID=1883156 RepID=UPI0025E70E72|nr:4'-phosphopantetheinyl transferase superfamily protein [Winogradskyella sp.]NRB59648.1 4-phosphopantetheinyl transferase family protein [Winogradskyella sp.]
MLGNDIVDVELANIQSNWRRPRYLDKLFTTEEHNYIKSSSNASTMVWTLWSMKEAAYKLYTQLRPSRFYNPKSFVCHLKDHNEVIYKDFHCYVNTEITSNYILSEASFECSEISSKIIQFEIHVSQNQSEFLQEQLFKVLNDVLQIDKKGFIFQKDCFGIPKVTFDNKEINVSLSHHGRFGAIAYS